MNLTNCLYSPADDIIAHLKQGGKQSKLTLVVDAPPAVCSRVAAQALVLFPGHVFGPLQDRNVLQKTSPEGRLLDPTPDSVSALLRTEQGTRRRVVVKPQTQTTFSTTAAKTSTTETSCYDVSVVDTGRDEETPNGSTNANTATCHQLVSSNWRQQTGLPQMSHSLDRLPEAEDSFRVGVGAEGHGLVFLANKEPVRQRDGASV